MFRDCTLLRFDNIFRRYQWVKRTQYFACTLPFRDCHHYSQYIVNKCPTKKQNARVTVCNNAILLQKGLPLGFQIHIQGAVSIQHSVALQCNPHREEVTHEAISTINVVLCTQRIHTPPWGHLWCDINVVLNAWRRICASELIGMQEVVFAYLPSDTQLATAF
jgi:hypothetical protein